MNPPFQGKSGTTPGMSRNAFRTSQRTNEDDSQSDPHPEAKIFKNQTTQYSGSKDGHDMAIGGRESVRPRHWYPTIGVEFRRRCRIIMKRSEIFLKLVGKSNGDIFWNEVYIKPFGENRTPIETNEYDITPDIQEHFTNTKAPTK